jgi:hypothetical protein
MLEYINHALKSSDIYGYPVTLNFQHKTQYRSSLGGSFSLITIAVVVLLTYNGAVSLLGRTTFTVPISVRIVNGANHS